MNPASGWAVAIFIRKVGKKWWLEDKEPRRSLADRVQAGVDQFRDPAARPSIYKADTLKDQEIAIAAVAWNATQVVERIKKADFVLLTDGDLIAAGLAVMRTPSDIPWPVLRKRHFEIVRDGRACSHDDLGRLVRVLIERPAGSGRFDKDVLRKVARKYAPKRSGLLTAIRDIIRATVRMITRSDQGP